MILLLIQITFSLQSKFKVWKILTKYFECDILRDRISNTIVGSARISEIIDEVIVIVFDRVVCQDDGVIILTVLLMMMILLLLIQLLIVLMMMVIISDIFQIDNKEDY